LDLNPVHTRCAPQEKNAFHADLPKSRLFFSGFNVPPGKRGGAALTAGLEPAHQQGGAQRPGQGRVGSGTLPRPSQPVGASLRRVHR
jgi:hypothetical protein